MKKFEEMGSGEIELFVFLAYEAIDAEFCIKRNCEHISPTITNEKCIECLFSKYEKRNYDSTQR
jgi:hypothetical protein